jgi:peptidylprolyl isomerase
MIDGSPAGRTIIEPYSEIVLRTIENCCCLYTGARGIGLSRNPSGDIVQGDVLGGLCDFGRPFDDELFTITHSEAGFLSMINQCKNTNTSSRWHRFCGSTRKPDEQGIRAGTSPSLCVIPDGGAL